MQLAFAHIWLAKERKGIWTQIKGDEKRKSVRIRKKHFSLMPQVVNLACVSKLRSVLSLPCPKQPFLCLQSRLPVSSGTIFFPSCLVPKWIPSLPNHLYRLEHSYIAGGNDNMQICRNSIVHLEENIHFKCIYLCNLNKG